jgi:SAM-dependent methyltransferase
VRLTVFDSFGHVLRRRRRRRDQRADFYRSRLALAARDSSGDPARLLERVSLHVHANDSMYEAGRAEHYLGVGLSAIAVVREALGSMDGKGQIRRILDFPCGYGRVLRFLRANFPDARITGAEVDADALAFCQRAFGIDTWQATPEPRRLSPDRTFDLIWCGSLVTHFDEPKTRSLLRLFHQCLATSGVCILSTHGETAIDWMRTGRYAYGLTAAARQGLLAGYETHGYGYGELDDSPGYGISAISAERMRELVMETGTWRCGEHRPSAWDNHHDIYVLRNEAPPSPSAR